MWPTFEVVLQLGVFVGIGLFMWSVSSSLETMARDVSLLAGRARAGPAEDADRPE